MMHPLLILGLPLVIYLALCALPRGWLTLGLLVALLVATFSAWHFIDLTEPTSGPKQALLTFNAVSTVAAGLVQFLRIIAFAPAGGGLAYLGLVAVVLVLVVLMIQNLFGA